MDARRLRLALLAAQIAGVATLVRSIAYDRWITVLAAVVLIAGATAAQRGKTWGVALALASAAAFPVAWFIGIAPPWFCLVGILGALPFALTSRAFARFDKSATALLAVLAATAGTVAAVAYKAMAWTIFTNVPALRPSVEAQHGLALAALVGSVVVGTVLARRSGAVQQRISIGEEAHVDVPTRVEVEALLEEDDEQESDETRRNRLVVR